MRQLIGSAAIAILALLSAGCATMNISAHLERGVDFARYHTYDWGPADALPTGDPRLDNNPFFHDYLQGRVEKELARRGFVRADKGTTPDLLLHYHAAVNQRVQINEADKYCFEDCRPQVIDYEQGTLVLDFVDGRTNHVVWRGWAQDSVQGTIDNQDRLEQQLDKAVTGMMARLPGRL